MTCYQKRVIEEKKDLDKKAFDLSEFIGENRIFLDLDDREQELLKEQCEFMWQYSEVLGKRIELFLNIFAVE